MEKVLTVEIKDQSPGIAQKYISRLTERFYRIEEGRKTKIEGTGLGLAIVKHIANRHKTKLHIESILNKGSSFKLTFPLIDNKSNLLL